MIPDYHVHLRDERGGIDHTVESVERFVEREAVDEIGFVEHVYYFERTRPLWSVPYQAERCVYPIDRYVDAVVESKRRGLPVRLGLEVDWTPPREQELAELLAPYPWDFVVGSVHWIDGHAVDDREGAWTVWPPDEVWRRYAEELVRAARSGHFDVLGHPDRPKRFGPAPPSALYDVLEETAAAAGIVLELSSDDVVLDGRLLATRARVTLGSDAHEPSRVGNGIARTAAARRADGAGTVTVFDRRVAREEPLG